MSVDQESLGFSNHRRSSIPMIGLHPMQQASRRISEFREGRSALKAKDLVGLLLCHGARAWRSNQPEAKIHLHIASRSGQSVIHLRLR